MKFDDETCTKNLKSLMFKNYKVLQRKNESDSKDFNLNDIFVINDQFQSNLKRVILPTPVIEEVYKKGKFTHSC